MLYRQYLPIQHFSHRSIILRCNQQQSLIINTSLTFMMCVLQNTFLFWPVDGKLDGGTLRNENLLFKDSFLQHIATSRRFLELIVQRHVPLKWKRQWSIK